jgi:DNA-binding NarL/FixJ family response regulator
MEIRVLIADDHRIMRHGLRSLLTMHQGIQVVGEAENGRDAVRLVKELDPHVVIMDVAMPELNGIEATRQIVSLSTRVKVISLSMHYDRQLVSKMLEAGASGYLLKDCAAEELIEAIRTVSRGGTYLGRRIEPIVVKDYVERLRSPDAVKTVALTPREREVLQLIAEGKSTKEIAERLFVSAKTVETHRRNMMLKLGCDSVAELTKYAIKEGLTTIEG